MPQVLIIDDDEISLELLQHILDELQDVNVMAFSSSSKALEYILNMDMTKVDLVICDWIMPRFDGLDLLQSLRLRSSELPFLMLTSSATREHVIAARQAGATDFIAKPFKSIELTEKIKNLLEKG